jgi:hypothetical protein
MPSPSARPRRPRRRMATPEAHPWVNGGAEPHLKARGPSRYFGRASQVTSRFARVLIVYCCLSRYRATVLPSTNGSHSPAV